jgi:thiol-disulfide isomerase/thioredoxin
MVLSSCNNQTNNSGISASSFSLQGKINLASGPVKIQAISYGDNTYKVVDSTSIVDGKFELSGKVDVPEMMMIVAGEGNFSFPVFVEASEITVEADTTGSTYYDYTAYGMGKQAQLKNYTVSGSLAHDEFMKYNNEPEYKMLKDQMDELQKLYSSEASKEKQDEIRLQMMPLRNQLVSLEKQLLIRFIAENPRSVAAVYHLDNYYRFNRDIPLSTMDSLLSQFTAPAKNSVYYKEIVNEVEGRRAVSPGNQAPDFTLLQRDSTNFTLSSVRGKYVLLDFWASWCKPCRAAIPHWKEIYEKYKGKDFEIVAVSNDSRWNDWIKALDEEQMPWIQVIDRFPVKNRGSEILGLYKVNSLPTYILLDKEGKIVMNGRKDEITAKLAELLN